MAPLRRKKRDFNHQLKNLPESNVTSDEDVQYLGTRRSQSNINYQNEVPRPLDIAYYPKRSRTVPRHWKDSSRLPSLDPYPGSAHPAKESIAEQKCFIPPPCFEVGSSYGRRCFSTSTMPGSNNFGVGEASNTYSGPSNITKQDVKNNSPLDTSKHMKPVKKLIHVNSLADLFTPNEEMIQTEERLMNQKKLGIGVYIVEPMKCDEGTKCEVNADTVSLNHEKLGIGVDIDEPMRCDEGTKCEVNANTTSLQNADTRSVEKRNKRDVSLVEHFTEKEIEMHIMSLTMPSSQIEMREMYDLKEEEACQLCGGRRLLCQPPPIYCSFNRCNRRIKDEAFYYTTEEELSHAPHLICSPCHTKFKTKFELFGIIISKTKLIKRNNANNQIPEEWVQCESCDKWQHQICGLYNKHKDEDNTADYICPKCLLEERKSNSNMRVDDNIAYLGAKDLPETILSYFLEQRLVKRLKEERKQTAKANEKSIDDVSEPEGLTLRVVYSADKISTVNKQFANFFHKENYPSELPYRSKVILLFQKVEGVDICIFALFVQEFGSECSEPNQRSTYIVYLDSVKYFRPERLTFSGDSLRTFVYHEILIGYLEYCKLRGFMKSYIWACPPQKGEDYIMYSHPKTQQIPNAKKLRQWYMSLLKKAVDQKSVTKITNLYDRFFVSTEESTSNMTAARLPYFEGSFWSYHAEVMIQEIEKEGNDELQKKVNSLTRTKLKGMSFKSTGCVDVDDIKNILLMEKLGKKVFHNKEDLMVAELNYSCTRCSKAILSGLRWYCEKCKNLQLCESCYDSVQELPGEHVYVANNKKKHQLSKDQVNVILSTTEDHDIIQENNMFDSRQEFLAFSQKHNYNFDTLRRAKHSSMMILHHLHISNKQHHPSQNSSSLTCTACKKDVSTTIYFPCLLCPDYRACTGCYTKNTTNLRGHHVFPTLPSANGALPRTVMVLEILKAFSHAFLCKPTASKSCSYPKCKEVKALFSHIGRCKARETKDRCQICLKWSQMMRIHVHHCQDLNCPVRHCRDMKERLIRMV